MENINLHKQLKPFVKEIIVLEGKGRNHNLPFFADGYPGIIYCDTETPIQLLPKNKILSKFFLHGQTIAPIELKIKGDYRLIIFQLYPFSVRLLFNSDISSLTDDCYNLTKLSHFEILEKIVEFDSLSSEKIVCHISKIIVNLIELSSLNIDTSIKLAVSTIIHCKGNIPIRQLRSQLFITERTFERKFKKEIGITPKQFSKVMQFSAAFGQMQDENYLYLTNVAYDNGFADQSHFIRTFKKYTGNTPSGLLQSIS